MRNDISYNGHGYALPKEFLREVTSVHPYRGGLELLFVWLQVGVLWWVGRSLWETSWFWIAYVPLAFLIAGRLGAFLQLIHEAAHHLLFRNREINQWAAKWLCGLPIGVFFEGYASGHRRHHAYTNTEKDPASDREKYRVTNCRDPKLFFLFAKDLVGWTALSIFFQYKQTEDNAAGDDAPSKLRSLPELCFVQLFILLLCFKGNVPLYFLLWLFPALSPHMFLMRIRGIAEHGLARQLNQELNAPSQGTFYTRSFLTPRNTYGFLPMVWLEKTFIGSFSVHYHHEHHLFPSVPFYHLDKVHARIADEVFSRNPHVYARGYVAAALRNLSEPMPQMETVPA